MDHAMGGNEWALRPGNWRRATAINMGLLAAGVILAIVVVGRPPAAVPYPRLDAAAGLGGPPLLGAQNAARDGLPGPVSTAEPGYPGSTEGGAIVDRATNQVWIDGTAYTLDFLPPLAPIPISAGAPVQDGIWSPDGQAILLSSWDARAQLRDTATGQAHLVVPLANMAWCPGGHVLVGMDSHRYVQIWEGTTGRRLAAAQIPPGTRLPPWPVNVFTLPEDDPNVPRFCAPAARHAPGLSRSQNQPIQVGSTTHFPGGLAITADQDGTLHIVNPTTGWVRRTLRGHVGEVYGLAVSPNGTLLASASADASVRIWDLRTGATLHVLPGPDEIYTVAWSPDGHTLLTMGLHDWPRTWDAATGTPRVVFHGASTSVTSAAWSPDGQRVLTVTTYGPAWVWDAATGRPLQLLDRYGATGGVLEAAWNPDGHTILTISGDGTAWLWDAASGRLRQAYRGP
ncbi:MAG TPA: WD40 repeat domain-containing protein [Chloroflexia bacterium]|nr:WD40 repeat domain-containing protein [Chloroflexia bacterium]